MSQVVVYLPASLRQFAGGAGKVQLTCDEPMTLAMVFAQLHQSHPGVVERALDEGGQVRQHVNVFVDGENIRVGSFRGLESPLRTGAEVWILPAVSGG